MVTLSLSVIAQTPSQINAARSLARQYGYTDSQINAVMNSMGVGRGTTLSVPSTTIATPNNVRNGATTNVFDTQGISTNDMLYQDNEPIVTTPGTYTGRVSLETDIPPRYNAVVADSARYGGKEIYGHDIFSSNSWLSFVPAYNIPTPSNYVLAAEDEVLIEIWGDYITAYALTISPDGTINVPEYGPISLIGKTIQQAETALKNTLSQIYSGLGASEPTTFLSLSLRRIRSLTINVVGDVVMPGTYTTPSLSTVASAIYLAGGITDLGTVRDIKLYRQNKLISTLDIYDFIVNGSFEANVRLEDNDLIIVGSYINLITLTGEVKRPMKYELTEGETIESLLDFSGGFNENAYTEMVHVVRKKGVRRESFDVNVEDFGNFQLFDGDSIFVRKTDEELVNEVVIEGPVFVPGSYAISADMATVEDLIVAAGGLKPETSMEHGLILRTDEQKDPVMVNFIPQNVVNGVENHNLMRGDTVRFYTVQQLKIQTTINISGAVNSPGQYTYREGMTLNDAILLASGFSNDATMSYINIARRNENTNALAPSEKIATLFEINLVENPQDATMPLMPYDEIMVRKAPNFVKQQKVIVEGEAVFTGEFVIEDEEVRLSEVITKAGGLKATAYPEGAKVRRRMTKVEVERSQRASETAKNLRNRDSLTVSLDDTEENQYYDIGIDLAAAMENPGSYADLVLEEGDIISIPKFNNVVKISGAVLYPNTVSYDAKLKYKDYIAMAGGFTQVSKKKLTYIVHMNGTVSTKKSGMKIMPGSEIVVPDKAHRESVSTAEALSVASSTTSTLSMIISMISLLRR